MKQKRTVPYPFSIFNYLFNNKSAEILLAYLGNKIAAGSVFLHYGGFVHYYLSATDNKYRDMAPNYLIIWEKIKSSLKDKFAIFDFGGTGKGSALEVFKKGWGGSEKPIVVIANFKTSLRESKIRAIFPLIPTFLLKRFAEKMIKYRV